MNRKRILWLFAVIGVVLVLGTVLWLIVTAPQQTVTLSDGTRVTLRGISVNERPKFYFGNPLQQLLAHLPGKLGAKFGGSPVIDLGDQGQTVLTLWLSCDTTNASGSPQQIVLTDSKDRDWLNLCYRRPYGAQRDFGFIVREWPRREKNLILDLYAKYAQKHTPSRIVVPNPSYAKYPQWFSEPLPATRRVGELEFTLQRLKIKRRRSVSNVDEYFRIATISTKATDCGEPTDDWEASSLALADATGNSTEHLKNYYYWEPGTPARFQSNWRCWPAMPGEDAVKLRVEFVKTNGYTSNDIFVVRGVPMSPIPPWNFITNLPAGRLVLKRTGNSIEVVPPGYDAANTNWSSRRFVLRSATDESGVTLGFGGGFMGVKAYVRRSAKTVDVIVAAPPVHWVEWIVTADAPFFE